MITAHSVVPSKNAKKARIAQAKARSVEAMSRTHCHVTVGEALHEVSKSRKTRPDRECRSELGGDARNMFNQRPAIKLR